MNIHDRNNSQKCAVQEVSKLAVCRLPSHKKQLVTITVIVMSRV